VLIFPSCTSDLNQAPESTNAIPGDEFLKHQSPITKFSKIIRWVCYFRTNGCWFSDISGIDEGETNI
jgi:hypothetical protein